MKNLNLNSNIQGSFISKSYKSKIFSYISQLLENWDIRYVAYTRKVYTLPEFFFV